MDKITLQQGQVHEVEAEAIVNAANNDLFHNGGVAAAIVEAGGSIIQDESTKIGPIALGEAAVTDAGKLKAKYVIHAASMKLGEHTTKENLIAALRNTFKRAMELEIKTIALPAVGTGSGGFPMAEGATIALQEAKLFVQSNPHVTQVTFVLNTEEALQIWEQEYAKSQEVSDGE